MGRPSERRKFLLVRGRQMLHIKPRNEIQSYGYWSYSEAFPVMEDKTVPITAQKCIAVTPSESRQLIHP